ncbi:MULTISPECIES: hypothetical protein [unclassified Streptomyces]|uniref:hypothetical protein n=1 Tax=unclassified Streptomyces TaxID=2593676 RepID=UPI0022592EAA|nr:hypothetical protein [Streptomyces sp. NBC_00555]MCX5009704.1 hypothetical protein [Streptomyces sp. NBC_00555]
MYGRKGIVVEAASTGMSGWRPLMLKKSDLADAERDGIELELPDLDLMSIDALDGTVLGQVLDEMFSGTRDPELGPEYSHHSSHSSFSSFSSHSSSTWSGRV